GMAGRFPGAADIGEFERLLLNGVCAVGPVPEERWEHARVYDPRPLRAGRSICPEGGFLADAYGFDPEFFGLSPAEATAMDPQQRLFLMAAWHALEDAGLSSPALKNVNCGVYAGNVAGDYGRLLEAAGHPGDAHSFMGSAASMLPARIAYHLDLKGPAISIDTACSSSLVAIAEACEALRGG
ncbi:polyketide synthase, partial [Methylogaea oryzae]